jgi:nucleolar MIF4G domain-containing protein 1
MKRKVSHLNDNRKERRKQERLGKRKQNRPTAAATATKDEHELPLKERSKHASSFEVKTKKPIDASKEEDPYAGLDAVTAAAMRADDQEIAALERQLGNKQRLYKEYACEGYGDDFGDFLEGLDTMVKRVEYEETDTSSVDEQLVPMKEPAYEFDEDDSILDELEAAERQAESDSDHDSSSESENSDDDDSNSDKDHALSDTYQPSRGQDIYGNYDDTTAGLPSKYVPPHLAARQSKDETAQIRRALNQSLNRLSQGTLISVTQSIAQKVYPAFAFSLINDVYWQVLKNTCVNDTSIMALLIPTHVAAVVGVHLQTSNAQLRESVVEYAVGELWTERAAKNNGSKKASNLLLILCYVYNFGLVHAELMYDIVRALIRDFTELDVELLLLLLSHSGKALRSDDPSSLKEMVIAVHKRAAEIKDDFENYSRVEYMLSAITDLKNNKRRKQDLVYIETTAKLRKLLGQIKSKVTSSGKLGTRSSDTCLRLKLDDILNAESKGRWWKVGASWAGNQHTLNESGAEGDLTNVPKLNVSPLSKEDATLLKLAAKSRMNTDVRRAIFCIMMGSADCEDSFEKLVRTGMLKGRTERETVRVLMECCGNEKSYNKFYSHLASRIIEHQPQCKFTFQLAFWDTFKLFNELKPRKAANLAKLLFHLVVHSKALKFNVLKAIELSSPEELGETELIFATIFFSSIFEHFDDPLKVTQLFKAAISDRRRDSDSAADDGALDHVDEGEALRASFSVFFAQVLKASPKYKKGTKFRANLKAAVKACGQRDFLVDENE